jgi:nucleoside-diphosphate-sugar epimerase
LKIMKTVLVTGATGFLGKHLVEQLRSEENSARLRILCRGLAPWEHDDSIEVVHGDVAIREHVEKAVEGATEIYHLAGLVSRRPQDQELLYLTHIEGTRNVCEAALKQGVGKIVLVSSSGTVAVSYEPDVHDEKSGYKHEVLGEWPYYLSKIFVEKLALDYHARHGLKVVVANPSLLLGPGDDRNSSTRDVAAFLKGEILAIPQGGLNFVDVRDVARGLILAMRSGQPGERYLLGSVNWTFAELIEKVAQISGRKPPKIKLPTEVSLWGARTLRRVYPLFGKSFEMDDTSIKMSACFWYCDSSKARQELGFQTRDPEETLRDTVQDLRARLEKKRPPVPPA